MKAYGTLVTYLRQKSRYFPWGILGILILINGIGLITLYSVGDASWKWALPQAQRCLFGLCILVGLSFVPSRLYQQYAYWLYGMGVASLVWVSLLGQSHMGAQRWLQIGTWHIGQPSEFIKIFLILALARYFQGHQQASGYGTWWGYGGAVLLAAPSLFLIFKQPDLGTALILLFLLLGLMWGAGLSTWSLGLLASLNLACVPLAWHILRPYQRHRILTFLDPSQDPLGAGYHVLQSKISLGSGEFWGKGFLKGTQNHLAFLPESQTDFIFTAFAEEFGFLGSLVLLSLYGGLLWMGYRLFFQISSVFGQLVVLGINFLLFFHMTLNMAMVMGLFPVVGIPLPFLSYGGSSVLTFMIAYGILSSFAMETASSPPMRPLIRGSF